MVSSIDYYVGQILQKVADKNIDDNTIIIFSSDNGTHVEGGRTAQDVAYFQSSGEYRGVKRDLYEGGIRVPFIVRWKGHVAPNSQSNFRGGFWDLYPTFSEVAGVSLSKNDPLDGISFKNALLGKRQKKA
ncbi:sulfatase-like hydrolase/transferase [Capnocytophaga canimorsus]|nr:sulfatase-like hydrolase/transferase [Capnocytophaga canimorsus]WGU68199.1 sulfatase-like hydrolase/transferase [Capnocytophaga canimorsus]